MSDMISDTVDKRGDGIRSVERAIDLLQALNRRPLSTLNDLHRETGLPKPSIVRFLRTFEAKGLAAQSSSYGTYHLLGRVKSLSSGFHHEPLVNEVAEEIMVDFTKREGWPLAIALFDVNAVVVRASTIPHTSLSFLHSSLNMRWSLVSRALGRCYLAHSPANERKILIEIAKQSKNPEDAAAHDSAAIDQMIGQVRERGYALRDPLIEPRSCTIAVPIFDDERPIASLGLTWITAAMSRDKAVDQYVPRLFEMADAISLELAKRSARPPLSCRLPQGEPILS